MSKRIDFRVSSCARFGILKIPSLIEEEYTFVSSKQDALSVVSSKEKRESLPHRLADELRNMIVQSRLLDKETSELVRLAILALNHEYLVFKCWPREKWVAKCIEDYESRVKAHENESHS